MRINARLLFPIFPYDRYEAGRGAIKSATTTTHGREETKTSRPTNLLRLEEVLSYLRLEPVHHDIERAIGRDDGRPLAVIRDVGIPAVAVQGAVHVGLAGEDRVQEVHFVGERSVRVDLQAHGEGWFRWFLTHAPRLV